MRVRRNEKSISINLSQERCSSDISFARSRLIEEYIGTNITFSKLREKKKGRRLRVLKGQGRDNNGPSNEFELPVTADRIRRDL